MKFIEPKNWENSRYKENKSLYNKTIDKNKLTNFKKCLHEFTESLNSKGESNGETKFSKFLEKIGFKHIETQFNEPNGEKLNIDLAVFSNKIAGTVFELKSPDKHKDIYSEKNQFNEKALHEIIINYKLYSKSNESHYFILSDFNTFYLIDESSLKSLWNTPQMKLYSKRYDKKNLKSNFYKIAHSLLDELNFDLPIYKIKIADYLNVNDKKLAILYKFFSIYHLLKEPIPNSGNNINKKFYKGFLSILGLNEIKKTKKIERFNKSERQEGSIIEATITQLKIRNALKNIDKSKFGVSEEEQLFEVSIQLILTWINRILFLKLLEAQLYHFNNGKENFRFLSSQKIKQFDDLERLFLQVLAIPRNKRSDRIKAEYDHIPYLNSSLFELTDLENETISISNLDDEIFYNGGKTLTKLLDFLDKYDFRHNRDNIVANADTLINSAILGRVFEKINGYKDGSYFTPSFITEYMCKTSIRKWIVNKYNELYSTEFEEFNVLINSRETELYQRLEGIINSIKICDPAVGSGHFLVSSLNEIIIIKHELMLLQSDEGKLYRKRDFTLEVIDDELVLLTGDTQTTYRIQQNGKVNREIQSIQKTIFNEKKRIIENCLFGVDINPNSVNICRLRLWIELLKNTYYTDPNNPIDLETLPNIDINIKCGNSLISRFDTKAKLSVILKDTGIKISDYKQKIKTYKSTNDKIVKHQLEKDIEQIQKKFKDSFTDRKFRNELSTLTGKIGKIEQQLFGTLKGEGFEPSKTETLKLEKELSNLKISYETKKIEKQKFQSKGGLYANSFEWRYEFPDILDDDGGFVGFDVVIGNPPYYSQKGHSKDYLSLRLLPQWRNFYKRRSNIYYFFVDFSKSLTNTKSSLISLIIPNEWLAYDWADNIRNSLINEHFVYKMIDFKHGRVFNGINTSSLVYFSSRTEKQYIEIYNYKAPQIKFDDVSKLDFNEFDFIKCSFEKLKDFKNEWIFSNKNNKIKGTTIGELFDCSQGILTGADRVSKKHIENSLVSSNLLGRGIFILKEGIDFTIKNNIKYLIFDDEERQLPDVENKYLVECISHKNIENHNINLSDEVAILPTDDKFEQSVLFDYLAQWKLILINRSTKNSAIYTIQEFDDFGIEEIKSKYSSAGSVQKIVRQKKWYLPLFNRPNLDISKPKIVFNSKYSKFGHADRKLISTGGGLGGHYILTPKVNKKVDVEQVCKNLNTLKFQDYLKSLNYKSLSVNKVERLVIGN